MTGDGRPLRFLALVLGLWIGARVWLLWPDAPRPAVWRKMVERVAPRETLAAPVPAVARAAVKAVAREPTVPRAVVVDLHIVSARTSQTTAVPTAPVEMDRADAIMPPGAIRYGAVEPDASRPGRWSASGWAILRDGPQGAGVATPQLGGSQAGVRLAYALDDNGRVAVAARVASALAIRQQEAALGIEWRPARLPFRLVAERRIGVANARGGLALGAVGGVSDRPVGAGFRLDGYAQAGAIARDGGEGYADGAIRIARPAFRTANGVVLDLGVGAWGAAQRGAHRVDIGPSATLAVPVGAKTRVRVALEWRQRIVGDARPASGPALSIGTDL